MNSQVEKLIIDILSYIKEKSIKKEQNIYYLGNYLLSSHYVRWCCINMVHNDNFIEAVKLVNYINNGVLLMRWKNGTPHIIMGNKLIHISDYLNKEAEKIAK